MYLLKREEGYAREIAQFYGTSVTPLRNQLEKLEAGGVLVSHRVGRTLLYKFNPRYPFLPELRSLLEKAFSFYPEADQQTLVITRKRPRRAGKPR